MQTLKNEAKIYLRENINHGNKEREMMILKKLVLTSVLTMGMFATGTAYANLPNTDYSETGKGAVGVSFSRTDLDLEADGSTASFDKQWNFGAMAEVVVAPKWAVGLNYMCSKSDETLFFGNKLEASLTTYELTAQYMAYQKDNFSLIPYVGWARDKAKFKVVSIGHSVSESSNDFLLGTKLVYDFSKQFSSYADIGFGSDVFKWGIGVAYKFTPELALSVGYDYRKVKDFEVFEDIDFKAKNFTVGLTYMF